MFIWKIFWFSRICHFFRWKYAPYNSYFWVNLEFDVSDHSSTHWNMFVYIIWSTGMVQSKRSHTEKKLFSSFSMVFFFFFFLSAKKCMFLYLHFLSEFFSNDLAELDLSFYNMYDTPHITFGHQIWLVIAKVIMCYVVFTWKRDDFLFCLSKRWNKQKKTSKTKKSHCPFLTFSQMEVATRQFY